MPYTSITKLPESIRTHLPRHAQEIYLAAFNSAFKEYSEPAHRRGNESREVVAHKVAWAAVKHQYEKRGDRWVPKTTGS